MTGKRRPLIPGRKRPWEGKSLSSIEATVPICTPLTLTGAPTLSPLRLPWNMQMKVTGLVNMRPEPTTIRATTRIAKLATTNAPITAGLTRLPMTAY